MTLINKLTAAFVVLFFFYFTLPLPAQGQGSVESDRAALVALYDATDGDNWTNNDGWKTDAPLSEWEGVFTNDAGRVRALHVGGYRLTGELPRELGNLTDLSSLQLNNNPGLTGEIPRELGSLTNLWQLSIYQNNLSGEIPRELGSLNNLQRLLVHTNNLSGEIPRELGSLANLVTLDLSSNNLTGEIPRELGRLTNLRYLHLSNNNLTGEIPRELGNLNDLGTLWLRENNLTGMIPYSLRGFADTINPQQGGVILLVGTPVPALPFVGALLLACGLYVMGRRKMLRPR